MASRDRTPGGGGRRVDDDGARPHRPRVDDRSTYGVHLLAWGRVFGVSLTPRVAIAAALALLVVARNERGVWLGAIGGGVLAMSDPIGADFTMLLIASLLFVRWRLGLPLRVAVGGVVAAWMAVAAWGWTRGEFPDAPSWATLIAGTALFAAALQMRRLAPGDLLLPVFWTDWSTGAVGAFERGLTLVIGGFALLGAGIAANLHLAGTRAKRAD